MKKLLILARKAIESKLNNRRLEVEANIKREYKSKKACFVTLMKEGELRGCIGSLEPRQELWKDVVENAKNAAFSDYRFFPMTKEEFKEIKIEISILSLPRRLKYKDSEELKEKIKGKGVVIKKNWHTATYLPQVWEQLPDAEKFLSSLCIKAGLNPFAWKEEIDEKNRSLDVISKFGRVREGVNGGGNKNRIKGEMGVEVWVYDVEKLHED